MMYFPIEPGIEPLADHLLAEHAHDQETCKEGHGQGGLGETRLRGVGAAGADAAPCRQAHQQTDDRDRQQGLPELRQDPHEEGAEEGRGQGQTPAAIPAHVPLGREHPREVVDQARENVRQPGKARPPMIGRQQVARSRLPGLYTHKRNAQREQVEAHAGDRLGQENTRWVERPVEQQRTRVAVSVKEHLQKPERRAEEDAGEAQKERDCDIGHRLAGLIDQEHEQDRQAGQGHPLEVFPPLFEDQRFHGESPSYLAVNVICRSALADSKISVPSGAGAACRPPQCSHRSRVTTRSWRQLGQ